MGRLIYPKIRITFGSAFAGNVQIGADFQSAFSRQIKLGRAIPSPNFGTTFDGVFLAVCGINKIPPFGKILKILLPVKSGKNHPILGIQGMKEFVEFVESD